MSPVPFHRPLDRGNPLVRQWRLLVALRRGGQTRESLAQHLQCSSRTVLRDLHVLQAAGLPVQSTQAGPKVPAVWSVGSMADWPRCEAVPVTELRSEV